MYECMSKSKVPQGQETSTYALGSPYRTTMGGPSESEMTID